MTAIGIENHDTTQHNRLTSRVSLKLVKVTCNLCDTKFSPFLAQELIKIYLLFSSPNEPILISHSVVNKQSN